MAKSQNPAVLTQPLHTSRWSRMGRRPHHEAMARSVRTMLPADEEATIDCGPPPPMVPEANEGDSSVLATMVAPSCARTRVTIQQQPISPFPSPPAPTVTLTRLSNTQRTALAIPVRELSQNVPWTVLGAKVNEVEPASLAVCSIHHRDVRRQQTTPRVDRACHLWTSCGVWCIGGTSGKPSSCRAWLHLTGMFSLNPHRGGPRPNNQLS